MKTKYFLLALACASLAFIQPAVRAQAPSAYPAKPVKLINPLAAGGGLDSIARKLATKLEREFGQPVVVENRPGASGLIAADSVVKSPPDGHTLIISPGSTMSIIPHVMKKLPFSPSDLVPVVQVGTTPFVMLSNPSQGPQTLDQFLTAAKAQPRHVSFGSNGMASLGHLMGEALMRAASVDLIHVVYKGSAPAITDLLGGQVNAIMTDFATARPYMQAGGRLRVLAMTGSKRSAAFPTVPTFSELSYPALEPMTGSILIWAPAATPKPVVEKIAAAVVSSLRAGDMAQTMTDYGYEPTGITGQAVEMLMKQESARWQQIIQSIGGITLN